MFVVKVDVNLKHPPHSLFHGLPKRRLCFCGYGRSVLCKSCVVGHLQKQNTLYCYSSRKWKSPTFWDIAVWWAVLCKIKQKLNREGEKESWNGRTGSFLTSLCGQFSLISLYMLLSTAEKPEQIKIVRKLKTYRPGKEGGFKKNLEWLFDFWRCLISIFRHLYSGVCLVSDVFITAAFFFPLAFLFFSFIWILQSLWFIKHDPGTLTAAHWASLRWCSARCRSRPTESPTQILGCRHSHTHSADTKLENSPVVLCGPCQIFLSI